MDKEAEIRRLEQEIDDLKRRFPAHSLKPAMFRQLEELEERLEELKKSLTRN
ncbi:histidine kinase [Calderihabitans maritimus]|uniref:Histidine kinase n=1 Tax=Calderihabitans maritimus TaxID=1246530 RepID=A0A1Z5HU58_9FIRM|nr:histidine kinase [Calderihabitans maritimus]GAW93052.1 histidine kinase [Calderihabitans maritimus]